MIWTTLYRLKRTTDNASEDGKIIRILTLYMILSINLTVQILIERNPQTGARILVTPNIDLSDWKVYDSNTSTLRDASNLTSLTLTILISFRCIWIWRGVFKMLHCGWSDAHLFFYNIIQVSVAHSLFDKNSQLVWA